MILQELTRELQDGKRVLEDLILKDGKDVSTLVFQDAFGSFSSFFTNYRPQDKYDRKGSKMVFLRHGFLEGASSMCGIGEALEGYGINNHQYNFMDCLWDLTSDLLTEIESEVRRTGQKVSYVGHSKGGLMGILASQQRPELFDRVITMAVPFQGSQMALFFMGIKSLRQMWNGHGRLAGIYQKPLPAEVSYLNLYTISDFFIKPGTNAALPAQDNVINIEVPGLSHNGFLYDERVGTVVYDFLFHPLRVPLEYVKMLERRAIRRDDSSFQNLIPSLNHNNL